MISGHGHAPAGSIHHYFTYMVDRDIARHNALDLSAGQCLQIEWAAMHLVECGLFSCQKEASYAIYDVLYARREVEHVQATQY